MSAGSSIEWTNATWNPVTGCTRVSAGCDNCYAVKMSNRLANMGQEKYQGLTVLNRAGDRHFNGVVKTHEDAMEIPLRWMKPRRIFVNSMSDLFHKEVPFEFIAAVYGIMAAVECTWGKPLPSRGHTMQVLTKRPERAVEFYLWVKEQSRRHLTGGNGRWSDEAAFVVEMARQHFTYSAAANQLLSLASGKWPLPNVWLGTSVEDQATADERIPHLLKCPAAVRFISAEPLLGPVKVFRPLAPEGHPPGEDGYADIENNHRQRERRRGIHWVIVGGESGPGARPMHPDWARAIRDQCAAAGVDFFFKQWGDWREEVPEDITLKRKRDVLVARPHWPGTTVKIIRLGKKKAGRLLDGCTHDDFPGRDTPNV